MSLLVPCLLVASACAEPDVTIQNACQLLEPTVLMAECYTPELEPGTYTIGFADATTTLAIPSEVTPPCFFSPTGY